MKSISTRAAMVAVLLLGLGCWSPIPVHRIMAEEALPVSRSPERGALQSDIILEEINQWFERAAISVISLARNPVFLDRDVEGIKAAFNEKIGQNREIINIFYGAEKGYFRLNSLGKALSPNFQYKKRPWYYKAMAKRELIFTEPYIDINTSESVITIAAPATDALGNVHGVVGADILVSTIVDLLNGKSQEIRQGKGRQNLVFIINEQGDELISSFQGITNGFVKTIGNQEEGEFETPNLLTRAVKFHRLQSSPWFLLEFSNPGEPSSFEAVYEDINRQLQIGIQKVAKLGGDSRLSSRNRRHVEEAVNEGAKGFAHLLELSYARLQRPLFVSTRNPRETEAGDQLRAPWFLQAANQNELLVSNKFLDRASTRQVIALAQPIGGDDHGVDGVLAAKLKVDFIVDAIKKNGPLTCIMNNEGHVVLSQNNDSMKTLVVDKIAFLKNYRFKERVETHQVSSELEFSRIHLPGWYLILQEF